MNKKPFFSIVAATYNVENTIVKFAESLNQQTFSDYEVLLSDGGSIDDSLKYFTPAYIRNLTWHKTQKDNGIYDALNQALVNVSGEWVIILGIDDTLYKPSTLQDLYNAIINSENQSDFYYTDLLIKVNGTIKKKIFPEFKDFAKRYGGMPPIHHQTAVINSSCFKKYGLFDEKFSIHADYDFECKVMQVSKPAKLNIFLVIYCADGYSSKLKNMYTSINEMTNIRKKYNNGKVGYRFLLPYLNILYRKVISKLNLSN